MSFDAEVSRQGGVTVLSLRGRLDVKAARDAEAAFVGAAQEVSGDVVLDMVGLEYIASAGLRLVKRLWKAVGDNGGKLVVRGAGGDIMEIFEMTGFAAMLDFED